MFRTSIRENDTRQRLEDLRTVTGHRQVPAHVSEADWDAPGPHGLGPADAEARPRLSCADVRVACGEEEMDG